MLAILASTDSHFGTAARLRYEALLASALRDIATDPERPGSVARPELGPGVRSYHVRHSRHAVPPQAGAVRRPRHLILFRSVRPGLIGIGRILHDGMELERHVPPEYGDQ